MTETGIRLLKQFEGFRGSPYKDAVGVLTIGYGTVLPLSESEATALLRERLLPYLRAVDELVTVPLTDNQRDALVSFTYNVGIGALKRSTLIKRLNAGDYDAVPAQLKRWNRAGGRVLQGLVRRRAAEAALWSAGP